MTASRAIAAFLLGLLLTGCASLPASVERTPTNALTNTADTRLGQAVRPLATAHPGKSGIHPLVVAEDAFAARVVLARLADRSLDLQYYIWHDDTTGQLLWQAVWDAAERGVRVRLLLDDANTRGLDPTLAALDAHPNIEVRLFNPFANRGLRAGDFISDFSRVNRRMHNKSFTADNQASIVGGRNIGDEYYGANMEVGFQDLDVLGIGPVVQEVSSEFDLFWNSASAYPAASVIAPAQPASAAALREAWDKVHQNPEAVQYLEAVRQTPLLAQLADKNVDFEWTTARVLHDDPSKVLQPTDRRDLQMLPQLLAAMGHPKRELDLVSPYFVPGADGTKSLVELAQSGVKVRVLTNSLSATDVSPVHAGYTKYRGELLEGGAVLYELKPGAAVPPPEKGKDDDRARGLPGSGSRASSAASLHAKTFAVDRERIFVGSYNLDPRSARLNTEMGVVIESPALAGMLSKQFDTTIPTRAYLVRRQPDGHGLEWVDVEPTGETRHSSEPGAGPVKRLWIDFLEILPIEWLL
ncbi:Phosphatidylserine/phosphatidylglycerophosphate/cardiolipin synthase [Variovorax sp. HW608]|uniref:phospholipase D family protein n=1 Tax=Variovorax sp. HW608 TaxID=1034889 RepID=UPI00081FA960|nr:phospholipase D family protein [Variovorax sp. HW608]SCK51309.1 Phosphatidylserine/phosphatidylglycerophosphate/cardiolipin synthase [Variovorax sp. HW608]